ncbi:MAG: hypothetical protein WCP92_06005 [bacterium]
MNNVALLISSKKTVFNNKELKGMFNSYSLNGFNNFLRRAKKNKILYNLRGGIRALPNYDPMELGCKIKPKSYVSCETVLFKEGIFFQYYGNTISCVSNDSRRYKIDNKDFIFYKIKSKILNNPIGIKDYDNYRIATPERALCDYVYINPRATIDAPEGINKIRLEQILPIYPKKTALYIKKLLNV